MGSLERTTSAPKGCDPAQLVLEDVPLSVHHLRALFHVLQPHLGIVPLCLQHELRVEKGNVGLRVHLLLHFKASIAGSFLEGNAANNKGVL